MILKIPFIILIIRISQISGNNENGYGSYSDAEPILTDPANKEQQIKFMNATLDMQLPNFHDARVINSNGSIYLLNGIDLFAVNVQNRSEGGNNLKKIGRLGGLNNQPISDIKASPWKGYTVFVADLDDFSNVYVVKGDDETDVLKPIEQLTKQGAHCKVKLFHFNRRLYCVIMNSLLNDKRSSMYLYKWRKSHFTQLETLSAATASELFVYTAESFALIVTVTYFPGTSKRSSLNVYIITEDDKLRHIQMFYISATNIFPVTLDSGFYFYTVSRSGRVRSYQWDREKFVKFMDHKDLKNVTTFASGENLVIGQINNELVASTNVKLSPAYAITSNFSKNIVRIVVTRTNQQVYVTCFYNSSDDDDLHMTTVKSELEEVHDSFVSDVRDTTGDCVTEVRDVQRNRIPIVEVIKNMVPLIYRKDRNENVDSKLNVGTVSVAKKVNIRQLNVEANLKATLKQVLDGIDGITAKLNALRKQTVRPKRNVVPSINTINVKRLNLPKELFDKILIKTNGSASYKGKITTKKLTAKSIKYAGTPDPNVGTILPVHHKTVEGINRIQNLEVNSINGINWNDFYGSLYLKDSPQPIEGNLIMSQTSRIKHLEVAAINQYPVSTLFTLNTDQEISSNLIVSTFHSPSVDTNLINGIDFGNDVARLNENNVIETPVKILEAHIGNLTLANDDNDEFITKHIVGTRVEDLSQIYNGKVIIRGSLKLANVILDSPKTQMFVGDQRFGMNVADHFWMKSVDQTLGNVAWTSVISTPQIFTSQINNVPAEKLVIINVPPKESVNLVFQRATVNGNVYTDPEFETILTRINKECVRRGSSTEISGTKTFSGLVTVNDFSGEFVDYPATENFVLNNDENKFFLDCTKKFESVTVHGNVEFGGDNLFLTHWNGNNLQEFFQNAVRINQPARLNSLSFTNIKATNLTVTRINNQIFDEIVTGLENSVGRQGNLHTVHINGDLNIRNLRVDTINEINFDNYLGLVVTSGAGGQIGGVKRFLSGLSVNNLFVRHVNSVDIGYWFENALHRTSNQVIGGKWALTTASINEMYAGMINGIQIKEIIDTSKDTIDVRSSMRIESLDVSRNMNGEMACDVKNLAFVLDNGLNKTNWNAIIVNGYVEWPADEPSPLNEILKFAVTGSDQTITGDVVFANVTYIDQVQSTGIVNNVNVWSIFNDCLVKNSQLQIVKGSKIFKESVSVTNLSAEKDLRVPFINDVNVVQLNNSIFRISEGNVISGTKTFTQPLKIGRLFIDGLLNGIPVNDIIFVNSTTVLPPIIFHQPILVQKDLIIASNLNRINFDYLINNIIRKAGPPQETSGMITFQNLVVRGDTKIPSINNIDIDEIVVQTSDSIQEIVGFKTVTGDVYIDGPAIITTINGLDVVDAYSSSIFLDQNMVIRRLDVTNEVVTRKGIVVNSQINGVPIVSLINWQPPAQTDLAPLWSNVDNIISEADSLLHQNYGRSFHLLYLDYAANIKLKFDTVNSHPVSFIIDTVHSGEMCGLDHRCDCVAQYDVSVGFHQIFVNRRPFNDRQIKMIGSNCNITVRTNFINVCTTNALAQTAIEWSTISGFGSLTINEQIFGVKLYEVNTDIFMLVNYANGSVIALKYDHQVNNWFTNDIISGSNIHVDVLQWKLFKILIVLSRPSEINSHDVARLWFYNTAVGRQGFEMFQEMSGEFNLCTKLYMQNEDKFVLFLSKAGSQFISVFMVHWGAEFQLFQTLALDSGVRTFSAFTVDDAHCLAVVTTNGYLYLYKYNNVEGWLQIVYGFFKDIESVTPFSHLNRMHLFVSLNNSLTVIGVHSQGLQ